MTLNLWPPALVIFTDRLPDDIGGQARGPVVFIKNKYATDTGLLMHELEHVKQWWSMLCVFHSLLYRFCWWYRLDSEVQAYLVQMQYPDRKGKQLSLDDAATRLLTPRYGFSILHGQAKALLTERAINHGV